ncbi:MAG: hypothetical protein FJ148_11185 [Deltaproteobacteria bacterium]|nr:hypothetical protein [Deltaproteobacteria bacterium]
MPGRQLGLVGGDDDELPLFSGSHIPRIRFERALERLDLEAAIRDAPEAWRERVVALCDAVAAGGAKGVDLAALRLARCPDWPAVLERAWQRLVGRHLDGHGVPGVLDGELAAAYLFRGGERERGERSLQRHLHYHPRDVRGRQLLAEREPLRAAARCAFHGGPVLDVAWALTELIDEDQVAPAADWLLSYAWFARAVTLDEVAAALTAEGILAAPPIPMPGDGRAFAWFLLDAGGRPLGPGSTGVIRSRERLQRVSPAAYQRYLRRAGHTLGR